MTWHILTGEYPPDAGGVADYSALLAEQLARTGRPVVVWTRAGDPPPPVPGVEVRRTAGRFAPADLLRLSRDLDRCPGPRTLLVQYVPHMYGFKGMNLPFAAWVRSRRTREDVRVMFHEVAFPFVRRPLKHNVLAATNRVMARILASSGRAYVSTPVWQELLPRPAEWLPIPSMLPAAEPVRTAAGPTVGHFGTFGIMISELLRPAVVALLSADAGVHIALIGGGSAGFRNGLLTENPRWVDRVSATGRISAAEAAARIAGCDVMLQPYPDGANSRRTTLMAGLAAGVATVATLGPNTEPEVAVAAVTVPTGREAETVLTLLADPSARAAAAARGRAAYTALFDWPLTVKKLLES